MTTPRVYLARLWGVIALCVLYDGIVRGSAVARVSYEPSSFNPYAEEI